MNFFNDAVIPAKAGIQPNLGSPTFGGLGPSLRWGDNVEVSA